MGTQAQDQEKVERFYLDALLQLMGTKAVDIRRGANPPDFLITMSDNRIAVEVTEFHSSATGAEGRPRRQVEEEWKKLRELIIKKKKAYPELRSIHGHLFFKELQLPSRRDHNRFVSELLNFSDGKAAGVTTQGVWFGPFRSSHPTLVSFPLLWKYLRKLRLQRVSFDCLAWHWADAAHTGLSECELLKVIAPKLKISRVAEIAQNWLLVVSGTYMSQSMGRQSQILGKLKDYRIVNCKLEEGPYDKVYIFLYMKDRVFLWKRQTGWSEPQHGYRPTH